VSRTQAATLISTGCVRVDGRQEKASYRPHAGERVAVEVPAPRGRTVTPESIPLRVIYEDPALLVVDKPAGMVVHPAPGHWSGTLVNALLGRRGAGGASESDAPAPLAPTERAGLVHRLDKETSGLVIVAKTELAHRRLSAALAERRIRRLYAVLSWGHLAGDHLSVDRPIGRDARDRKRMAIVSSGRVARTEFARLARFDAVDLLRARLSTGRTHQIRVHLASVGHPVVGDDTYGGGGGRHRIGLPPGRHFLHAAWLVFQHPLSGAWIELRSPLPPDLRAALAEASAGWRSPRIGDTSDGLNSAGDLLDDVGFYRIDDERAHDPGPAGGRER